MKMLRLFQAGTQPSMYRTHAKVLCFFLLVAMIAGEPSVAVEHAAFRAFKTQPPYQVRDYDPALIAYVDVSGERNEAVTAGFRLLANYIFGDNERKMKIPMTAPVTQIPQSSQARGTESNAWVVRFLMPSGYTLQSLPKATNQRVHFEVIAARRVASIQFSGFWSDANLNEHEAMLRQWMARNRLTANSSATFAYYDPPWTPWFMRTIEVMIDVKPS